MTTRTTEAMKIVARARRAGWDVEQKTGVPGGGWRITCPDGTKVNVHQTPSDVNSPAVILRLLNAHGFAEAEAKALATEERKRAAKLKADQAKNERAAARLDKAKAALDKAAGPYGPAVVTLAELLAVHKAPKVYHRVSVTRDMAQALLVRNERNRPLRKADIAEWCTILRTGRWHYTHQGIALDVEGRLQDGQHRLAAIVETGIVAELMISVGMPSANFSVVDAGRRRTAAQVLAMEGTSYAAWLAGATRLLVLYDRWGVAMLDHTNERVGNDQISDAYAKLDGDDISAACRFAQRLRSEVGTGPSGTIAAYYVIARAVAPDRELLETFAEALIQGVKADEDPAIHGLRRQLTRQAVGTARRVTGAGTMALIIKGWNARTQEGPQAKYFHVRPGSAMPTPLVPGEVQA